MSFIDFELIDIPIEFKEINPSDFNENYTVSEKEIIEPTNGYITDALLEKLEYGFDEINTVVVNAGVGQGKSKAILEMVKMYSENDNYVVIIAVPFLNLIEQYVNDCEKFLERNRIFNQIEINEETISKNLFSFNNDEDVNNKFSMSKFKIHILTSNGLLGNAGENSLFQSGIKSIYFEELKKYCLNNSKKIIIVFDEIHDSIYNFKEDLIINLWNYQGLIQKIITLSATYNEASKEVIKYLSELTNKRIQIIESKRDIVYERQSELYLNFYSDNNLERDHLLVQLIKKLTQSKDLFDMMVYSSNLIKKFISKPDDEPKFHEVNQYLYGLDINKCYNDIFDSKSKQKYNPSKINIGTNFSTGINIEKTDHTYIIIFPKDVNIEFFNNKGVFTNGANTIIQAIARQRKKGKIYVFLPEPLEFDEKTLLYSSDIKNKILSNFNSLNIKTDKKVCYSKINKQGEILDKLYSNLLKKIDYAIAKISESNRDGMNVLCYPKKEIFKLYKGEKYLAENYFSGNISTYILWASLCNQFLNCRLTQLNISKKIRLSSNNLENEIEAIFIIQKKFINSFYEDFALYNSLSEYEKYEYFYEYFFSNYEVLIDNKKLNREFSEKIKFTFLKLIFENSLYVSKEVIYLKYLKSSIYFSNLIYLSNNDSINICDENKLMISYFKEWMCFVDLLKIISQIRRKYIVLPTIIPSEFENLFIEKNMKQVLKNMMIQDKFLSNKIFPFYERFRKCKTDKQFVSSFYRLLIETIYNVSKATSFKEKGKAISLYVIEENENITSDLKNVLYKPIPEFIL